MRRPRRPRPVARVPFIACSRCANGLLIEEVMRDGGREREADAVSACGYGYDSRGGRP